jgi:hypothetical protein
MSKKEPHTTKKFDPKELIREASKVRKIVDPELGEILYHQLRLIDMDEINKSTDPKERIAMVVFKYLGRAYPDLTLEDLKVMPLNTASRILDLINKDESPKTKVLKHER